MNKNNKGMAIAAMVLGIVSVSLCALSAIITFFHFLSGMILAIIALICGIIAVVLGKQAKALKRAIAAFILGIIGTSLSASIFVIMMLWQQFM